MLQLPVRWPGFLPCRALPRQDRGIVSLLSHTVGGVFRPKMDRRLMLLWTEMLAGNVIRPRRKVFSLVTIVQAIAYQLQFSALNLCAQFCKLLRFLGLFKPLPLEA